MPEEKNNHIIQTIKAYGKGLLGFIRRRVKTDADAEDILQDVWYQLSSVVNAQPIEQTGAWLYKVATNKIIDKNRKKTEELYDKQKPKSWKIKLNNDPTHLGNSPGLNFINNITENNPTSQTKPKLFLRGLCW